MQQFKVGDWLIGKYSKNPICIETIGTTLTNSSVTINGTFSVDQFTLWQPKEGEWCWFWNSALGIWFISTLKDFGEYNNSIQYRCNSVYYICEKCEPFIGELPSFLKDK